MEEGEIETRGEGVVVVLASGGQSERAESRHPVFVLINPTTCIEALKHHMRLLYQLNNESATADTSSRYQILYRVLNILYAQFFYGESSILETLHLQFLSYPQIPLASF